MGFIFFTQEEELTAPVKFFIEQVKYKRDPNSIDESRLDTLKTEAIEYVNNLDSINEKTAIEKYVQALDEWEKQEHVGCAYSRETWIVFVTSTEYQEALDYTEKKYGHLIASSFCAIL